MSAVEPRTERIGYVIEVYPSFSQTSVVDELLGLEAADCALEVFSLRPPLDGRFHETLADVRAPVHYLPVASSADELWFHLRQAGGITPALRSALPDLLELEVTEAVQALFLAVLVRQRGITHLHAHLASAATTVARAAARLAEVSYSFAARAQDIFPRTVDTADLRAKIADAAVVTTDSNFNVHHLRSTFDPVADRVYRVYSGIDLARFPWTEPTDRPPVIAAVGPFVESRGFEYLLEAVGHLVADGRDIRLDLVGTGPLEAELRQRVDDLGLATHVDFLGTVSQRRLRRVLRNAALFAAPCVVADDGSCGGLSTVLLEAMALGTACVTTSVGSLPEVVYDEVTGLVVPDREPRALAAAIGRLMDDTELRFTLARAARHLVEQEFDVRLQTRQLRRLLLCRAEPERKDAGSEPRAPSGSLSLNGDPLT